MTVRLMAVAALVVAGCRTADRPPDGDSALARMLPGREVPDLGFAAEGEVAEYHGVRLVDYLSDRAAVPMSYGFRALAVRRYHDFREPRNTVLVEVYEMGSAADAVGIVRFLHREAQPTVVGEESRQDRYNLAFAQGRYYVRIRTVLADEARWGDLLALAAWMARRLPADRSGLEALGRFPADAVRGPVHFARTETILGQLAALPPGDAFAFDTAETVALVAEREDGQGHLVLIAHPTPASAAAAADLARQTIGRAWSRWAVTRSGRFLLTFVRRDGQCTSDDHVRAQMLVNRIAAAHP